jgi:2-keto-4-pentenoate hydratase/2-oxohepta-3-ene-1,7-dioic acid hydratase in catechol pathway
VGVARKPPLFLMSGDTVSVEIERIGRLSCPVKAAT